MRGQDSEARRQPPSASGGSAAASGGRAAWLLRRLPEEWPDLAIVVALIALFSLVHRYLEAVEIGGDAISKWHFVRQWSYQNDFSHARWDHHHARMGVNAFTWVVQKVFGRNWRAYYVGPFFITALQIPIAYALGRRLSGRLVGVLAALFITYLGATHRAASQLLPDGFAGSYALLAAYVFARFVEAEHGKRTWLLAATAVVAFVGYLAKETFVFFYPGFVLALWLSRRSAKEGLRDISLFCGVLLAGLALETAAYRALTDYSSRIAVIRGTHMRGSAVEEDPVEIGLAGVWDLFKQLDRDWHYLLVAALLGAVWLLFVNRRNPQQGRMVALLGLSHVTALSITSQLWQRPLPRYMDPAIAFSALCAATALGAGLQQLLRLGTHLKLRAPRLLLEYRPGPEPARQAAWLLGAIALIATLTYWRQRENPPFDGFAQGIRIAKVANTTYERNLPLVAETRRAKVLTTLYDVYLSDKRLARSGILPQFGSVRRRYRKLTYFVKDPSVYNQRVLVRLLDAGCVLNVLRGSAPPAGRGYADAKPEAAPPKRCDAELVKAIQESR